jgi:hypothetical protein
MKRKNLFALALLLFLSGVALSNESSRPHCRATGNVPCDSAKTSPQKHPAAEVSTAPESHMLLHTFIKLLYI